MILPKISVVFVILLMTFSCQPVNSEVVETLLMRFLEQNVDGIAPLNSLVKTNSTKLVSKDIDSKEILFKETNSTEVYWDNDLAVLVSTDAPTSRTTPVCTAGKIEIKCYDCKSQVVCDGTVASPSIISCPSDVPYCITDEGGVRCSKSPTTPTCGENPIEPGPNDLRCSGSGYFPAPDDCSKYFVCDTIGSAPYAYQCPGKMIYDLNLARCRPKRWAKDCKTLKCDLASRNPVTVHPVYPQYFGLCNTYDVTQETAVVVLRCPNNFVYNRQAMACTFKCKTTGYFQGSERNKFFLCYKWGFRYQYLEQTCPPGFYFDVASTNCIKQA